MRDAETWYTLLASRGGYSFLEVEPKTGRTHQIRVHLKAINYPVISDDLYASKKPKVLGFDRLALHAYSIEFKNLSDKNIIVKASLPEDFKNALEELGLTQVAKSKGLC